MNCTFDANCKSNPDLDPGTDSSSDSPSESDGDRGSVSAHGARRATFWATSDSYPWFGGGFYPSDG